MDFGYRICFVITHMGPQKMAYLAKVSIWEKYGMYQY